jgi:hypothetical protein
VEQYEERSIYELNIQVNIIKIELFLSISLSLNNYNEQIATLLYYELLEREIYD